MKKNKKMAKENLKKEQAQEAKIGLFLSEKERYSTEEFDAIYVFCDSVFSMEWRRGLWVAMLRICGFIVTALK